MKRLAELLYALSESSVKYKNIIIDKPIAIDGDYNTSVRITGRLRTGTYGQRDFFYNRMDLSSLPMRVIPTLGYKSTLDLLPELNISPMFTYMLTIDGKDVRRQAFLTKDDIEIKELSSKFDEPEKGKEISLNANPDSYLFYGTLSVRYE